MAFYLMRIEGEGSTVTRETIRVGAIAGWIGLSGLILLVVGMPMAIAGQPPTGSSPLGEQLAYFGHASLAPFAVLGALASVAIVPFAIGLRTALRGDGSGAIAPMADAGLGLVLTTIPLYLLSGVLGTVLVDAAARDQATFSTLFRFYDVLYNGAADVFEGAWIAAFSIAMLGGAMPRWLAWLGIAVGLSRWIKAFAPFVAAAGVVGLPGTILFLLWFVGTLVSLTGAARRTPSAALRSAMA